MAIKSVSTVLICVFMLGIILEQVQVEGKSCCPTTTARNCYNVCRLPGTARETCAKLCGCKIISGSKCPAGWDKLNYLPNSGKLGRIDYCKLGCSSIMCNNMNNVDGSVEHCGDACDQFCNDDASIPAVVV
ncbi:unnamed protein product [Urochloa humidicola]